MATATLWCTGLPAGINLLSAVADASGVRSPGATWHDLDPAGNLIRINQLR